MAIALVILFILDIATGSTSIPLQDVWSALTGGDCPPATARIVIDIRLVKAVVAVVAGAAISLSGLQMQTLFRNPLAGPYVLGVSSGASLGVALFLLGAPLFGLPAALTSLGMAGAAWIGAALVLIIVSAVAARLKDIMVILILGMMLSSGIGSVVQILQYLSRDESLKAFVVWTMGSLGDVTAGGLAILIPAATVGILLGVIAIKPLNLLLFGEDYARSMGLDLGKARTLLFVSTTLIAGTVTAFCGPIGFIGLAIPHVARMIWLTSDHRVLVPATLLSGASVLLLCDIFSKALSLPINSITSLLGIPIVVLVVIKTSIRNDQIG